VDLVDVMSRSAIASSFKDFSRMFTSQFHSMELRTMHYEETEYMSYFAFYVNWALKEAFVKAVGQGLSYDLSRVRVVYI
jgi:phosphopantetheine--protein transferase-like protein